MPQALMLSEVFTTYTNVLKQAFFNEVLSPRSAGSHSL